MKRERGREGVGRGGERDREREKKFEKVRDDKQFHAEQRHHTAIQLATCIYSEVTILTSVTSCIDIPEPYS